MVFIIISKYLIYHSIDSDDPVENARRSHQFSDKQLEELENESNRNIYVTRPRRCELAIKFGLPLATITAWFSRRRSRQKK